MVWYLVYPKVFFYKISKYPDFLMYRAQGAPAPQQQYGGGRNDGGYSDGGNYGGY